MYCAYITSLTGLHKHSNADRLQCATVFGNNVIVDLSYYEGQRVIYFPVDGQLSEEFANDNNLIKKYVPVSELSAEQIVNKNIITKDGVEVVNVGGYMEEGKRNITALKLRGEKSEGLVLPIEVLSKYTDVSKLKDGDQITVLDGHEICKKYIPKTKPRRTREYGGEYKKNHKEEKEKISYPFFIEHIDTQQLAFNQGAFKPGDTCYITLKMHGTSARTANTVRVINKRPNIIQRILHIKPKQKKDYTFVSGTRRTTLRNYDGGFYGSNEFRQPHHEFFASKLPKGVEVYYEIVGYQDGKRPIMGSCSNDKVQDKNFKKMYGDTTVFSYGCNEGESAAYVYRMTMMNEDGFMVELPWEQVQIEAEKMGAKCVPTFEKFIFTTWDDLMERVEKYYDGADPIGKTHVREGVVVRIDNRQKFTAYKHKNFSFKVLSGIIADSVSEDSEIDSDILSEM